MAVRLKDIARELSVSVVTVSKVLRNQTDISDETRQRVLKRMKELNYRPNLAARALVTGRTYTIGLVVPDLLHPFFAQLAKGLSDVLRKRTYSLIIASSEEDPELERQEIDRLLARSVDAILVASAEKTLKSFGYIAQQKTPYVLLDRRFSGLVSNFVGVDDRTAGFLATNHLIEQGCKRIAHIRGPEVSTGTGRLEGYKLALARKGRAPLVGHIVPASGSGWGGYGATKELLACRPRPDAIFCYNDPIAIDAMRAILDARIRIPQDIALVGCGNLNFSDVLRVPLSTVDQSSQTIGEVAGKLALSLVESKKLPQPRSILLEPKLVVRASSLKHDPVLANEKPLPEI
jgi:LacI family transcriptional regulator